jgi:hypothetical protein
VGSAGFSEGMVCALPDRPLRNTAEVPITGA